MESTFGDAGTADTNPPMLSLVVVAGTFLTGWRTTAGELFRNIGRNVEQAQILFDKGGQFLLIILKKEKIIDNQLGIRVEG